MEPNTAPPGNDGLTPTSSQHCCQHSTARRSESIRLLTQWSTLHPDIIAGGGAAVQFTGSRGVRALEEGVRAGGPGTGAPSSGSSGRPPAHPLRSLRAPPQASKLLTETHTTAGTRACACASGCQVRSSALEIEGGRPGYVPETPIQWAPPKTRETTRNSQWQTLDSNASKHQRRQSTAAHPVPASLAQVPPFCFALTLSGGQKGVGVARKVGLLLVLAATSRMSSIQREVQLSVEHRVRLAGWRSRGPWPTIHEASTGGSNKGQPRRQGKAPGIRGKQQGTRHDGFKMAHSAAKQSRWPRSTHSNTTVLRTAMVTAGRDDGDDEIIMDKPGGEAQELRRELGA
ncbi:hypothetical protein G7046_g2274 [Stylonectria norvegica]|nr:hypothetical protein G7046_g2274 [Stylonectria norvegica]